MSARKKQRRSGTPRYVTVGPENFEGAAVVKSQRNVTCHARANATVSVRRRWPNKKPTQCIPGSTAHDTNGLTALLPKAVTLVSERIFFYLLDTAGCHPPRSHPRRLSVVMVL